MIESPPLTEADLPLVADWFGRDHVPWVAGRRRRVDRRVPGVRNVEEDGLPHPLMRLDRSV
ncbi:MAG: hypothetical protein ACM3QU_15515 [Verrucomicrobiota bacterium]